jgi:hypothetical protein
MFRHIYIHIAFGVYTADIDLLCGIVVRVSGYRCRGSGFDSRRFQIFWEAVGLLRGPLSLVRSTEERLRSRKPRLTTGRIRCAHHETPSNRKSWHYFANKRRSLGRHSSLAERSHGVSHCRYLGFSEYIQIQIHKIFCKVHDYTINIIIITAVLGLLYLPCMLKLLLL